MILRIINEPVIYFDLDELTKGRQKRIYVFTCLPDNEDRTIRVRCPEDKIDGDIYTGATIKAHGRFRGEVFVASKIELWEAKDEVSNVWDMVGR